MQSIEDNTQSYRSRFELREINFIHRILGLNINHTPDYFSLCNICSQHSPSIFTRQALAISKYNHTQHGQVLITEEFLKGWAKLECISENNFSWIDTKNERLCDFIWSYIRLIKSSTLLLFNISKDTTSLKVDIGDVLRFSYTPHASQYAGQDFLYDTFHLEQLPLNNKIKDCIIAFFDMLDTPPHLKENMLIMLKEKWLLISQKDDVVRWADNDIAEWAWNYFKKDYFKKYNNSSGSPNWFIIHNKPNDYLKGVVTAFDLLTDFPDSRELLLKKLKIAWSQHSYRNNKIGKKAVNIILPEDIIKKLNAICLTKDRRKNEVITHLIMEEYKKLKNSGQ